MHRILLLPLLLLVSCTLNKSEGNFSNSIMVSSDIILKNSRFLSNEFKLLAIDDGDKSLSSLQQQLMNINSVFERKDSIFKITAADKNEVKSFIDSCVISTNTTNSKIAQIAGVLQLDKILEGNEIQKTTLITDINVLFNFVYYSNLLASRISIDSTENFWLNQADSVFHKNICFQKSILNISSKEEIYSSLLYLIRTQNLINNVAFYSHKKSFITPYRLKEEMVECSATTLLKNVDSLHTINTEKKSDEDFSIILKNLNSFKNLCKENVENPHSNEIDQLFNLMGYSETEMINKTNTEIKVDILVLTLKTRNLIFSDIEYGIELPFKTKVLLFQKNIGIL